MNGPAMLAARVFTRVALAMAATWSVVNCAPVVPPAKIAAAAAPPPVRTPAPVPAPAARKAAPPDIVAARVTPDARFREDRPKAGPERPFKVPAVKRFKLKNGLPVILAESHKLPLLSLELVIRTGGAANPAGQAGLADLTADLLDEGTKNRTALQIADEIAYLGATLGASAGWDASSVSVSALSENIDNALDVWADVLLHPAFDEKEFTRVRANLVAALARRKDSPPMIAGVTLARVIYGEGHPYGWPTSGTPDTLRRLTPGDLRKFHDTYYRPNNAVLVAAGDITESQLRVRMDTLLGGWKARAVAKIAPGKATPAAAKTKIFLVDKPSAPQSSIRIGLPGIERTSPDYHRALVMNHILGSSFKRLDLNLREQKGWTYGVRSLFEARRTPGPWTSGGEFVAAHTADAVAEIMKEIKGLRDADITDAELQTTKDEIIKAFPARFATVNQIAAQMATLAVYGLPDNDLETFTKKVTAVSKADVRKAAQKYLRPDALAIVVVGDRNSNEGPLRKLADVELRDLEGNPVAGAGAGAPQTQDRSGGSGHVIPTPALPE